MRKNVMRKWVVVILSSIFMVALAGCGTKTGAMNQSPENSSVVEADEREATEGNIEETGVSAGAENENIVLYSEKGSQDYCPLDETKYEPHEGTINATEDIPLYDGKGYCIGYIKNGSTVSITEYGTNAWSRFENPIDGTDYDYLYVLKDYAMDLSKLYLDEVSMKQGIEDYINRYGLEEIEYTFLNEKASDMEMYECRMDSIYDNEMMYTYWIGQQISNEEFSPFRYATLYIECEEDTDGWIICRIYYKDYVEPEYY